MAVLRGPRQAPPPRPLCRRRQAPRPLARVAGVVSWELAEANFDAPASVSLLSGRLTHLGSAGGSYKDVKAAPRHHCLLLRLPNPDSLVAPHQSYSPTPSLPFCGCINNFSHSQDHSQEGTPQLTHPGLLTDLRRIVLWDHIDLIPSWLLFPCLALYPFHPRHETLAL